MSAKPNEVSIVEEADLIAEFGFDQGENAAAANPIPPVHDDLVNAINWGRFCTNNYGTILMLFWLQNEEAISTRSGGQLKGD